MDRGASCPAHQICWLDQQLTRTGRPRSGWVQRVKVRRTRVLLCKSLNFLGEQCPQVTRKPIHLENPGVNAGGAEIVNEPSDGAGNSTVKGTSPEIPVASN